MTPVFKQYNYPKSYDFLGNSYFWITNFKSASLDVEHIDTPIDALLKNRVESEFLEKWTQAESFCKILDIPIMIYLKNFGLENNQDIARKNKIDFLTNYHTIYKVVFTCAWKM